MISGRLPWAIALFLAAVPVAAEPKAVDSPAASKEILRRHTAETARLALIAEDVLGPLPAIATTPFFGLTALTGAALISEADFVRGSDNRFIRRFREHALIGEARRYASPSLLLILVLFTVLSYLANSGKIRGIVGKLIRMAEDSSVAVCYSLLVLAAAIETASEPGHPSVSLAGPLPLATASQDVFGAAAGWILGAVVGVGLALVMVVRFAFDILIWLSPFPLVDFVFETAKKVFSAAILFLCLVYPMAAAVLSVLILAVSLLLLGWALRLLGFALGILLNPILGRFVPFLRPRLLVPAPTSGEGATLAAPAHVLSARGLRSRQAGTLLLEGGRISFRFRKRPFVGFFETRPLLTVGERLLLGRALGWIELRVVDAQGAVLDRLAMSRLLLPEYDELGRRLRAEDVGAFGTARLFAPGAAPAAVG